MTTRGWYAVEIGEDLIARLLVFTDEATPDAAIKSVVAIGLWCLEHQFKGAKIIAEQSDGSMVQLVQVHPRE